MLQNIKIKTFDNESISIKDVDYIGLGDMSTENLSFPRKYEQLFINSNRGTIKFPLEKIKSIELCITVSESIINEDETEENVKEN